MSEAHLEPRLMRRLADLDAISPPNPDPGAARYSRLAGEPGPAAPPPRLRGIGLGFVAGVATVLALLVFGRRCVTRRVEHGGRPTVPGAVAVGLASRGRPLVQQLGIRRRSVPLALAEPQPALSAAILCRSAPAWALPIQ